VEWVYDRDDEFGLYVIELVYNYNFIVVNGRWIG